ncbi:unnamed protein product [Orchesella dallaii]|uniref:EGF-like domain-containing protein n=1 Tax=Orchesella dallaii TaxID=48710 RepID=A0ABP1PWL3_9HEXA
MARIVEICLVFSLATYTFSTQSGNLDEEWKLIVVGRSTVHVLSGNTSGIENVHNVNSPLRPFTHGSNPTTDITYDARNRLIYWSDYLSKTIFRATIEGANITILTDIGLNDPRGIAFDWITGNIYFIDRDLSSFVWANLVVCRNDSNLCSIVVHRELGLVASIALDPNEGIMFWNGHKGIMRAGMDGTEQMAIVTTKEAIEVTIDLQASRIYWIERSQGLNNLNSALYDGSDRKIVIPLNTNSFDVCVFENKIFWRDHKAHYIKSADKSTGSNISTEFRYNGRHGFKIFHIANQPIQRTNPCKNSPCSHICTISPSPTTPSRCFCPVGMTLNETDLRNCVEDVGVTKLVVALKNTIMTMRFDSIGTQVFDSTTIPNIGRIGCIIYNPVNNTLILSDTETRKIYEYNIRSKQLTVLVGNDVDNVTGMDIDPDGENLYWINGGKENVEVMSLRTKTRVVLITLSTSLDHSSVIELSGIVVVPSKRSLYISGTGKDMTEIWKFELSGTNRSTIRRLNTDKPIILKYDEESGNIMWVGTEKVEFMPPTRNNFHFTFLTQPFDVVKYKDRIYWTDMFSQDVIFRSSSSIIFHSKERRIKLESLENNSTLNTFSGMKMTVLNRDPWQLEILRRLRNKHECSSMNPNRKRCSHLCLLSGGDDFVGVCRCPTDFILSQDGMTCIKQTCAQHEFTCSNGKCISKSAFCDGTPDCSQREDEISCGINQENKLNCQDWTSGEFFRCNMTGICIPKSWLCDGTSDCPSEDDSDERECNLNLMCPDGFFKCNTTKLQCILSDWVCDKDNDCDDGSDENQNCEELNNRKLCPDDYFSCNGGECIEKHMVCDGYRNCVEVEDERDCEQKYNISMNTPSVVLITLLLLSIIIIVVILIVIFLKRKSRTPIPNRVVELSELSNNLVN